VYYTFSKHGQVNAEERTIETAKTRYAIVEYFNENKSDKYPGVSKGRVYEYVDAFVRLGLARYEYDGALTLTVPVAAKENDKNNDQPALALAQ
jgi:hypothetical protein